VDIYIETNYANQPGLYEHGIKYLVNQGVFGLLYETKIWSKDAAKTAPKPEHEKPWKDYARAHWGDAFSGLVVLDCESWWVNNNPEMQTRRFLAAEKYITVLRWTRDALPSAKVGLYGSVPATGYWQAQAPTGPDMMALKKANEDFRKVAATADFLSVSLYPVSAKRPAWVNYARENIVEAMRISNNQKPIYVVLNPRYHSAAYDNLGYKPVEKDFFRLQLETAHSLGVKGVIVWGWDLATKQWSENLPWWEATREFLQAHREPVEAEPLEPVTESERILRLEVLTDDMEERLKALEALSPLVTK
jgi:hypothetical protein